MKPSYEMGIFSPTSHDPLMEKDIKLNILSREPYVQNISFINCPLKNSNLYGLEGAGEA